MNTRVPPDEELEAISEMDAEELDALLKREGIDAALSFEEQISAAVREHNKRKSVIILLAYERREEMKTARQLAAELGIENIECPFCGKEIGATTGLRELVALRRHLETCKRMPGNVVISDGENTAVTPTQMPTMDDAMRLRSEYLKKKL